MDSPVDYNTATCPTCGMLIDVSNEEVFAKIHCSGCGTWMRVRQIFANYEIQGIVGDGGQGVVYRANDLKLNRPVAMKVMRREFSENEKLKTRFEDEARITASLNHPNIVKVFSFGEDQGLVYLAMELVNAGSLDRLMTEIGKVPEEKILDVGIQIARGLRAGLEKGLIHRDIKPGNILFADDGTPKLADFGLAILIEKQHEEEGDVWATPFYVSPEKLDGKKEDFRSDMYSLAATMFHALAGRPPFITETHSMSELKKIKSRPIHLLSYAPHVSNATGYLIDKALSVEPGERFGSYNEFIENLEFAANELRKAPKAGARRRLLNPLPSGGGGMGSQTITFAVVAIVVVGGLGYLFTRQPAPVKQPVAEAPPESFELKYDTARRLLGARKFDDAAAAFRSLYADNRVGEPIHSWSAAHEALAEFFAGRPSPGVDALKKMGSTLTPNALGLDAKTAEFFAKLGKLGGTTTKTPVSEAALFDKTNTEAIGLLIIGLKNWETGEWDEGVAWLKEYQNSTPAGTATWAGEYRRATGQYLADHVAFREVADKIASYEAAPAAAKEALGRIPATKDKLKSPGLVAKLSDMEREYKGKIEDALVLAAAASKKQMEELQAAELEALTGVKMKLKELCENYRFSEALAGLKGAKLSIKEHVTERDLLVQRIQWLVNFKEVLINDLLAGGYPSPVLKKNGQRIEGGIGAATDVDVVFKTNFGGTIKIPWADIAPESILAIANTFIKPNLPIDVIAERQWQAGVFGLFTGRVQEGIQFMDAAAAVRDDYRIQRSLFFESTNEAPAPAPEGTPPPAPEKKPEPPPQEGNIIKVPDGTEMAKEALNPALPAPGQSEINLRRPKAPGE